MYHPNIGLVSRGTQLTEELIDAFGTEIKYHYKSMLDKQDRDAVELLIDTADQYLTHGWDNGQGEELLEQLMDALNNMAPPYCYFGPHEGDLSDYGFWPNMDMLQRAVADGEVATVNDPSDLDEVERHTEAVFCNDHGNVSLYCRDSTDDEWELVWSCV